MPRTSALFLVGALAIAALPPLNGFVSEFVIYSALMSGGAASASTNVAFVTAAAALAFVGAVSALAMTRAFGIAFLGKPRESGLPTGSDPPRTMQAPMLFHAAAALALGLFPELGLRFVSSTVALFPVRTQLASVLEPLLPAFWASRLFAAALLLAVTVRWIHARGARLSVTWGCGYTAVSSRLQYTGSSFSNFFTRIFDSFLPALRRAPPDRTVSPSSRSPRDPPSGTRWSAECSRSSAKRRTSWSKPRVESPNSRALRLPPGSSRSC